MQRHGSFVFCAAIVIASFCCPPPLQGIEIAPPMHCPITGEDCNAGDSDCQDVPAPVATSLPSLPTTLPDHVPLLVSPSAHLAAARATALHEELFWLLPTRTIQLRI